jgi:hypothetical protein
MSLSAEDVRPWLSLAENDAMAAGGKEVSATRE